MKCIYFLSIAAFSIAASYAGDGDGPKPDPQPKKLQGAPQAALGLDALLGVKLNKRDRGDAPRREVAKKPIEIKTFDLTLRSLNNNQLTWQFLTSQPYKKGEQDYPGRSIGLDRVPSEEQMDYVIKMIKDIASEKVKPIVRFNEGYFNQINGWYRTASFGEKDALKTGAELGRESPYYEAYLKQLGYYFMMAVGEEGVTMELRQRLINVCRLSDEKVTDFLAYLPKEKKVENKKTEGNEDAPDDLASLGDRMKFAQRFLLKNLKPGGPQPQPAKKEVKRVVEDNKEKVILPEDTKEKPADNATKPRRKRAVIIEMGADGKPLPPPPPAKMPPIINAGGLGGGINADMFKNFKFNKKNDEEK